MARLAVLILLFLTVASMPKQAGAQLFSSGRQQPQPTRSLSVGYSSNNFVFNGVETPDRYFTFTAPSYSLTFTQPNLVTSLTYGREGNRTGTNSTVRQLLDVNLTGWMPLGLFGNPRFRVSIPVVIHSGHRSVWDTEDDIFSLTTFNLSTLGLGTGLLLQGRPFHQFNLQARATPILGMLFRNFEGSAGNTRLLDIEVRGHRPSLFRGYGLSFGYTFRLQRWNANPNLLQNENPELFDYRTTAHTLDIGINW